jgi:hypothetical protein
MSQVSTGILGGLAVILTLGAVQLASGRDLATDSSMTSSVVNRSVKSDRGNVQLPRPEGRTVSVRLEGLPDTSVLIRIPGSYRLEARDGVMKPAVGGVPAVHPRRTVACEAVVSVLTDVAKQLQPGRCMT